MVFQEKHPFPPSQEKRYEISPDIFSRDRIQAVYKTVMNLKAQYPFVAGLTVYGSLSKNKFLQFSDMGKTDIDANLFIDVDILRDFQSQLHEDEKYLNEFELVQKDMEEEGIEKPSLDEIEFRTIRNFITDRFAEICEGTGTMFAETCSAVTLNVRRIAFEGPYSLQERSFIHFPHPSFGDPDNIETQRELNTIAAAWTLDVGGGLKPYRDRFLSALGQLDPQITEQRWQFIRRISIKWERNRWEQEDSVPEKIRSQYPATFQEAIRYLNPHHG